MGEVIVNLIPLIVGAAVAPLYAIAAMLVLQSPHGLTKAAAFAGGGIGVRLIQGVLFGLVIGAACKAYPEPGPKLVVSTLMFVLGLILLVTAIKQWRKESDPDEPTPQWLSAISGLSAFKTVVAGALFPIVTVKQWVFTLSAIGVIEEYGPGGLTNVGMYLAYVLATQTLVLAPMLAFAVAPRQAARPLRAIQGWLERNSWAIVTAMSLIFGVWFLFQGASGLVG